GTPNGGVSVPNTHFRALVPAGNEYHYQLSGNSPAQLTVELGAVAAGDAMIISLPYTGTTPFIYRDWWIDARSQLRTYASANALRAGEGTGFYYHEGN